MSAGLAATALALSVAADVPAPPVRAAEIAAAAPDYVGAATCKQCHASEFKAWSGSHHRLAMQEADASSVLGDFDHATFEHGGVTSTFFKRDGKYVVRTDGADGKLADFDVAYTFGVDPLQQYLIAFPGGRYQALGIAWDARPSAEGGQRWFHLYPDQAGDHTDPLHWTGRYQNWNLQCAECHSTDLRKNYVAATDSYRTTFSEINVACESCHGPASRHVAWMHQKPPVAPGDSGLVVRLRSRWNEAWHFPSSDAKIARRDRPAADALMNVCGNCHARRATIAETGVAGAPLEDTHRLSLLTQPLYHSDGQQQGEVYVWGSFRQSKMFQRGVTCMDCHEPHALKLRAEGNALCGSCHNATAFDSRSHHFHNPGGAGAQCVDCHMPAQNYMVVDARRDHAIRVPRPDLSIALDTPNACTSCHRDRQPDWAAAAMDGWYGPAWRGRQQDGTVLHAGATQGARALPGLLNLARDKSHPAIVRATAASLAQPNRSPDFLAATRDLLADPDPLVRIAALGMAEPLAAAIRLPAAAPLLADPVRGVRVEAARVLADLPDSQFPDAARPQRERALAEYVESLEHDADWPTANVNLGNLRLRQGQFDAAKAAFERALVLDPRFAGASINLADLFRRQSRDLASEDVLREALTLSPQNAEVHHALGLALVRKGERADGLAELAAAARLAPDNSRFAYVHAIGLNSTGRPVEALAALREADARRPYQPDILSAIISINREAGDITAALDAARKLATALPGDPGVARLISELEKR